MAWHLKGAAGSFEHWMSLPEFDRQVIYSEVLRRIKAHNAAFQSD